MAQFDVYRLGDGLVVDCQSDYIGTFDSRIVAPLIEPGATPVSPVPRLHPRVTIDGADFVVAIQLSAAVPAADLRRPVANLRADQDSIKAAIDMLFTGF